MGGKKSSGKHYTSVGKFPAVGKRTRRILKQYKHLEVSFRSVMAKADLLNGKISDRILKKIKFENNISNYARNFYQKNEGKIAWARIVQAIRLCQRLEDDFKATIKKSRNEHPSFYIKFKKADIEKYYKAYPEFVPVEEKKDKNKIR